MPELPEVETVRRGLAASIEGTTIERVILNRKDLRIPFPPHFAKKIAGATITHIDRRAKYLLIHLNNGHVVIAHLGMSGTIQVMKATDYQSKAHDHVLWYINNDLLMVFHDPRRFGLMTLCGAAEIQNHPLLAHLGPEPFSNHFHADYLASRLMERRSAVKLTIMDQVVVVGVGNIYACEALFLSKVNPLIESRKVAEFADRLVVNIRQVLESAIESGGSTLRDYVRSTGDSGYFQHAFQVYGREGKPCFSCSANIIRTTQAGRSTFLCNICQ